jgi:hypothetical protein
MHVPSVLCRPRGHAADVRTNAKRYTRGVEPLCSLRPTAHIPVRTLTLDLRTYSCDPHRHRRRVCVGEPHLAALCRCREPQRVGTRCSPKPSDARSNHLGRLDPHHLPALAWSLLSFLCAVTVARRRSRVVAMVTPPPIRPTAVALMPVCASVRPCLVQPRTHVPVPIRATMRALAWRGQGQTFGSLSRQTLSALRPATGCGFAADGDPSSPGVRAPTRSRSCTLALAHERANPVVAFPTSSETKASRSRPPRRSTSPRRRERPSAWTHGRQEKSVHVFVRTYARRRTP